MTMQNDMTQCENNLSTQIDDTMNSVLVDHGNEPSQLESEMNTTLDAPDSNTWEVTEITDFNRSIAQTQNVSAKGDTLDRVSAIPTAPSVNRNPKKNKPPKFLIPIIVLASIAAVSSILLALVIKRDVFSDSCKSSKATISGSSTDANKSGNVGNQPNIPTVNSAEAHPDQSTEESEEIVFFSSKKTKSEKPPDPSNSAVSQKVPKELIDNVAENLPSTRTENYTVTTTPQFTDESEERVYFSSNKTSSENTPDPMSSTVSQKVPNKSIDNAAENQPSIVTENSAQTPLNPSTEESEESPPYSPTDMSSQVPQQSFTEQSAYNPLKPSSDDGQQNHKLYELASKIGMEKSVITREGNGFIPQISDEVLVVLKKFGAQYDTDTFSIIVDEMAAMQIIEEVIEGDGLTVLDMRLLLPIAGFRRRGADRLGNRITALTKRRMANIRCEDERAIVKMKGEFLLKQLYEMVKMYEANPILLDLEKIRRAHFTANELETARIDFNHFFTPIQPGMPIEGKKLIKLFICYQMRVRLILDEKYFCSGSSADMEKIRATVETRRGGNGKSINQSFYVPEMLTPSKFFNTLRALDPLSIQQQSGNPLRQLKMSDPKYENDWNAILKSLDQFCQTTRPCGYVFLDYDF